MQRPTTISKASSPRAEASPPASWTAENSLSLGILIGLVGLLVWGYWNTLGVTASYWDDPKYSHGYLIPLFTIALLWLRRDSTTATPRFFWWGVGLGCTAMVCILLGSTVSWGDTIKAALLMLGVQMAAAGALLCIGQRLAFFQTPTKVRWAGVGLLAAALAVRLFYSYLPRVTPDMYSMLFCLAGVFLLVGGIPALKWAGPAVAFLLFMFPLPGFLAQSQGLQRMATVASTYCLQTLGVQTYCEGTLIVVGETMMEVANVCSGLNMLTVLVALSVAVALVVERPLWERFVVVLSAVPVALIANIVRITAMGLFYLMAENHFLVSHAQVEGILHDWAGRFMMPVALGLLYLEFKLLSHLFVEEAQAGPVRIGTEAARRSQPPSPVSTA